MNSQLKRQIKALAIYQIIGGVLGIGLPIFLLNIGLLSSLSLLIIIPFVLGLYSYSIYCGITLFKEVEKGLTHSKINQCLQVISFIAFGYAYQYISGVYFLIGIDWTDSLSFNFNFGISSWEFNINTNNPTLVLTVNLVAIFLIVFIDKARSKLKAWKIENELSFTTDNN